MLIPPVLISFCPAETGSSILLKRTSSICSFPLTVTLFGIAKPLPSLGVTFFIENPLNTGVET